jgi:hypothetical protein
MVIRSPLSFAALLLLVAACPGDPIEGASGTLAADGSSSLGDGSGSASLDSTGVSATQSSDSNSSTGMTSDTSASSVTSPSTTEPGTESTTDPSGTDPSGTDPSETDPSGTDPSGTDASAGTSSESGPGTTETTAEVCAGDEAADHDDPSTAIQFGGLDCLSAPVDAMGVLDAATGVDWWWFYGTDSDGTCEPDSVRITVTGGGPLPVCARVQPGCTTSCTIGAADGDMSCCGTDVVELVPECGTDDSTSITFSIGAGTEACLPYTFQYEF